MPFRFVFWKYGKHGDFPLFSPLPYLHEHAVLPVPRPHPRPTPPQLVAREGGAGRKSQFVVVLTIYNHKM